MSNNKVAFPYPNQNLLLVLSGSEEQTLIDGISPCTLNGCLPPVNTLSRSKDDVEILEGYPFTDPVLGTFILFSLPSSSHTTSLIRSANILVSIQSPPMIVNLSLDYTLTVSDNEPIIINFYTCDPAVYGGVAGERFWLLPNLLDGTLASYDCISGSLIVPIIANIIVKVSDNVSSLRLSIGTVPTDVLQGCPGASVSIYDNNCTVVEVVRYELTDNGDMKMITADQFIETREILLSTIEETSISLLLPIIPRVTLPTDIFDYSGSADLCYASSVFPTGTPSSTVSSFIGTQAGSPWTNWRFAEVCSGSDLDWYSYAPTDRIDTVRLVTTTVRGITFLSDPIFPNLPLQCGYYIATSSGFKPYTQVGTSNPAVFTFAGIGRNVSFQALLPRNSMGILVCVRWILVSGLHIGTKGSITSTVQLVPTSRLLDKSCEC